MIEHLEPHRTLSHRLVRGMSGVLVVPFLLFDEIIRPLFRPLVRALARLSVLRWADRQIAGLPPYVVLVMLLIPFVIAEPLKILGLYFLGSGHISLGIATLFGAYGASFVIVDRIYEAGRGPLSQIPLFVRLMGWVTSLRDALLSWIRGSAAWRTLHAAGGWARDEVSQLAARLRRRLHRRP